MFNKAKEIRRMTSDSNRWEKQAIKIAEKEMCLANQVVMEANTAKAKEGLLFTAKVKEFLVGWASERSAPFKITVAKMMKSVSKHQDMHEAVLKKHMVKQKELITKQNALLIRQHSQLEQHKRQKEEGEELRARAQANEQMPLLDSIELLAQSLPGLSRPAGGFSAEELEELEALGALEAYEAEQQMMAVEDIEAICALKKEEEREGEGKRGLTDDESVFIDAAIDSVNMHEGVGEEWNGRMLGENISTADIEQEFDFFQFQELITNIGVITGTNADGNMPAGVQVANVQNLLTDARNTAMELLSDAGVQVANVQKLLTDDIASPEIMKTMAAEAEELDEVPGLPQLFNRVVAEAAAALLYAGGSIDPKTIESVRADSILGNDDLLEEIEAVAIEMLDKLGGNTTLTKGLSWLSELEATVLQRLDLDSFDEMNRGSFLQFLALQNSKSILGWLRLGYVAAGTDASVVGRRASSNDVGGGDDGQSILLTDALMDHDDEESFQPKTTKAMVANEVVQQARRLAAKDTSSGSLFANITRLERSVCTALQVDHFADLGCGHSSFTDFCAALPNVADIHGLISGNTHRAAQVLLFSEGEQDHQNLTEAGLELALAECFGQPTFEKVDCGTLENVKQLCSSMKRERESKYGAKSEIGETIDVEESGVYSSNSNSMCAAPLLCRTRVIAKSAALPTAGTQFETMMVQCIRNAPLLAPLRAWLQWDRQVECDSLRDFCLVAAASCTDLVFLEERVAHGGEMIRVDPEPSNDKLEEAIDQSDPCKLAFALLSLYKEARGTKNMSSELIRGMFVKYFRNVEQDAACNLVLDVINLVPDWSCLRASIASLILPPLATALGSNNARMEAIMLDAVKNSCTRSGGNEGLVRSMLESVEFKKSVSILNSVAASGDVLYPSWSQQFQKMLEQDHTPSSSSDAQQTESIAATVPLTDQPNVVNSSSSSSSSTKPATATAATTEAVQASTTSTQVLCGGGGGGTSDTDARAVDGLSLTLLPADLEIACRGVVEDVRSEFMKQQGGVWAKNTRRALDRLSGDLYSDETHWILELIQNADDNAYIAGCTPRITFQRERGAVVVINNEVGFEEKNVRAICSIADSTKERKAGHIGRKGIGFKACFSISDQPEIHSKGFHFSLHTKYKIVPEWVGKESRIACIDDPCQTYIVLPLRPNLKMRVTSRLYERFETLSCRLLLFLNRLKTIVVTQDRQSDDVTAPGTAAMYPIEDGGSNGGGGGGGAAGSGSAQNSRVMSRVDHENYDSGMSMVELKDGETKEHWLVFRKLLNKMPKLKPDDPEATEIAMAVLVDNEEVERLQSGAIKGTQQQQQHQVFAFLPVACYGFKFIVNADFHLSSSREAVNRTSPFNEKVRDNLHLLFVDAVRAVKAQEGAVPAGGAADSSSSATPNFQMPLYKLLQKIPLVTELQLADGFFASVATKISQALQSEECIPLQSGGWSKPLNVVYTSRERLQAVPATLLAEFLGLDYVRSDVIDFVEPKILSSIRVNPLNAGHVLSLIKKMSPSEQQAQGQEWVFKVLLLLDEMNCLKQPEEEDEERSGEEREDDGRFGVARVHDEITA